MPAPASINDFLDVVRKSQQVDTDRLDAYLQKHTDDTLPPDPKKLAALLIRDGLLTNFQAEQFLQGRYKGFTLGDYRILERIGTGGTGTVFLAEHQVMKRRVAVKILPASIAREPGVLERFRREAQAVAALDHPNIVRAYDFRQQGQTTFLVMEYINGPSLQQVMESEGPLSPLVASEYVRQAAVGLHHAHEAGLVHRDVKPGNLLVDPSGLVKILDLGLARFTPEPGQDSLTKQFDEHTVMGTADYLAPEQAINLHDVDARADIYSLGATLYSLLAGEPPFASGTVTQKLLWHQMRDPTPLDQRRPEVPAELADIVATMMAKDVSQRFQSGAEVAEALEPFCATTPTPQGPARPGQGGGAKSSPYVKSNGSGPPSSRRRHKASLSREAQEAVRRPERDAGDSDIISYNDDDRPRRRREPDIRKDESTSLGGLLALGGLILVFLLVIGGVIGFLVFGPSPTAKTATSDEDAARRKRLEEKVKAQAKDAGLHLAEGEVILFANAHAGGVERVAFSSDGRLLVSSGKDKLIKVWDLEERKQLHEIRGNAAEVYGVLFDGAAQVILSAAGDGTARAWNYPAGTEAFKLQVQPKGRVTCVTYGMTANEILTGGDDHVVRLWQAPTRSEVRALRGHTGPVTGLVMRHKLNQINQAISASADKTLKVWDVGTGKDLRTLGGHTGECTSVAVTPDGAFALSGSSDGTVRQWHIDTGHATHTYPGHTGQVFAVAASPDNLRAASGGTDTKVYLWDLKKRAPQHNLSGHTGPVTGLAFAPDGLAVASCGHDGSIRVWGIPTLPR